MPAPALGVHSRHCGEQYRDRASHMLRAGSGDGVVGLLGRALGRPLSLRDLHSAFEASVLPAARDVGAAQIPFAPPTPLPAAVVSRMLESAAAAGCRTADRQAKHHAQEVAICAAIADCIRKHHPEVWERGMAGESCADEVCIIDIGAAAGELLHLFQTVLRTSVVLVEFYRPPRMVDELYADDPNFKRIWKKVEDVDAADLQPMSRRVNIVVAKHLCGDGSCHAMSQVVSGWRSFARVDHMFLVPCCQQMSTWSGYCGRGFLTRLGLTSEDDFEYIRCKTGWKSVQHRDSKGRHRTLHDVATLLETLWHRGRADYLRRSGASDVELTQFISDDVTVKNVMLVASWPRR
eukprot:TRINITY_DN14512_c0_g1_i1.p1 TRINITY_DN14512_c0_g1~~TRINITY_DN14512_c0_g1_i1.p1  ORF type:complete len:407 (+),score=118.16 TRINITY_DN14512_c0_g1_i1:176-1222(+)